MSKAVATGPRLITVGIALAGVSAALFVVPGDAVAEMFVDRAELDDDEGLRIEGEDAVPFAIVRVTSAESSASSPADDDGRFRVLSLEFRSSNCRATVTDGVTTVQVVLDECTPTTPTTPPPTTTTTTAPPAPTTTAPPASTTTTTTTTTTAPPTTTTTTTTTTAPPTTTTTTAPTTTTTTTTTVPTDPVTFTDLHDRVPYRCYMAEQSTVSADRVSIAIENGGAVPGTFQRRACIAATTAFNPGSVTDTFTVTVTAPPGKRLTRVTYSQTGSRLLQRSIYWRASGTGQLTANGLTMPFSFTHPGLARSIDLTGQNVESTTISVSISMSAGRSTNQPRVTDPPGSASISVTSAAISVESA
jgi:hypothetical protein